MASSKQSVSDEFPPPEVSTAFSIQGLEPQLFKIQGSPLPSAIKIALTLIDTIICKYPRGYKIMSVEPFQGTEFAELEELPNPESITIYIGTSVKSFELPLVPTDYKIDIRKMAYYSQKCDWSCLIASDIINACVKNDKSKSDQPEESFDIDLITTFPEPEHLFVLENHIKEGKLKDMWEQAHTVLYITSKSGCKYNHVVDPTAFQYKLSGDSRFIHYEERKLEDKKFDDARKNGIRDKEMKNNTYWKTAQEQAVIMTEKIVTTASSTYPQDDEIDKGVIEFGKIMDDVAKEFKESQRKAAVNKK